MQCTQVLYDPAEESAYVHREPRVEGILKVNGKPFNVMTGENIIGRDPELCSIVLQFQSISAEHAKIDAGPDGHTLCDMRSRNKTKLKEKVLKPYIQYFLEDGDTIFFADIKAAYHISPEQDEKTNGDSDVIPETPARLSRSVIDKSVVVPETPDAMDTSSLDESYVPSSQSTTENTLKNVCTTSETSFVASSQPPPRPSTCGAQHDNDVETPAAQRDSSRLRSSCESQASLRLALSESLIENDTSSRSLEDRTEADAMNVHGRSIYEADTQMITFSNNVKETPDKPDSRSSTPDLDESLLYGAETQIVFSPNSFKKPANRNVGKLSLAKQREVRQNRLPDLGSANESVYEADTQLIFPSDIDSPKVERGSENGTPGREECLYEANTQVLPSPKSRRSATKKVQFSVENGSDEGTPKSRKEGVYAAEAKAFPHSDVREEVYEAETQVLPGLVGKDPASESEKLHEAETQVLPGLVGKDSASESEKLYEAETQVLPGLVGKDSASETEKLYEAETQLSPDRDTGSADVEDKIIYDSETQAIPPPENPSNKNSESDSPRQSGAKPSEDKGRVCGNLKDNLDGKAAPFSPEKENSESESKNDIYRNATEDIPRGVTPGGSEGDDTNEEDRKVQKNRASAVKADNMKTSVRALDSDDSDAEELQTRKIQKNVEDGYSVNTSVSCRRNGRRNLRKKGSASADKAENSKTSVPASDSDDTDTEELKSRSIRKKGSASAGKLKNLKTLLLASDSDGADTEELKTRSIRKKGSASAGKLENLKTSLPASDSDDTNGEDLFPLLTRKIDKSEAQPASEEKNGDETDKENIFDCPTQKIKPKAPIKREDKKTSEAEDNDETDDEDMFAIPIQKTTTKAPKKTEQDKKTPSQARDSEEKDKENIFDCPTQKIEPHSKPEDKETSEAKDGDETDEEDMFTIPTQKITPNAPKKREQDKKTPSHLSKAKDSGERDEENIFDCPTQKIEPHSKPEETFEAKDSDETDDEAVFTCPTQKVTLKAPTKTEDQKTFLAKGGDKEDIFNCPTQKIPNDKNDSSTELIGTVDDDNSNDSDTLLKDYKEEEMSQWPDSDSIAESPVQEEEVSESSQQLKSGRARNSTNVSEQNTQLEPSHSQSEEVTEKPVEGFDNEERVLPAGSDTPKPNRGEVGPSSHILDTESKLTQKLSSAEKNVESDNEEDIVAPSTAESQRPKRGKLSKTSLQTVVPESKTTEKLRQSSAENLVEERSIKEDKLLPGLSESPRPKRGKLAKTISQTSVAESKRTEKLRQSSMENFLEKRVNEEDSLLFGSSESPRPKRGNLAKTSSQSLTAESKLAEKLRESLEEKNEEKQDNEDKVLPITSESPRPKRGKQAKTSSQSSVAESKLTEKLRQSLMEKNEEEQDNKEDKVLPTTSESPRPKRRKQAKTSSQSSVAESKLTEKLRQSLMEKNEEEQDNEEDKVLPTTSESPRPKRGKQAKTSSQSSVAESKLTEKLRQSLMEKNEEEQDNEEDKVLPTTSEYPRPQRGKQAKTSSQSSVAEPKLTEKLRQSSSEKSVEKRDSEERVLPGGSESPTLKRGRTSRASSQTLIAEKKPSEKSAEKPAEKRSNEDSPLPVSSGIPRSKRGRFSKKICPPTSEAEKISEREETAGTSRQSGIKRPSPQKDDQKLSKRVKIQEMPAINENVQKLKSKRQLYSPRGPDKVEHDSEEENDSVKRDDASTPQDGPSSEDTAKRRSGRVKKPTWKIRGGDAGLTKKFVLSYSQDTDDVAAAESSEEDSSVKSKGRGRPKKSSLTPKESPGETRQKVDIDAQPRSKTGQFATKRKKDAQEESQKLDAPRRASKARVSKVDPKDSDRESVCSEAGTVERRSGGRRRRLDSSDSVQSTPLTRSSSMMSETQTPSRRSVQRQPKLIHRVLFTGFADGKLEKQVLQLGAKIVDSVDGATVAVTDKLRRTVKLLSMMARGQPIVSPDWIRQSEKARQFRDPWECLLFDAEAEKKFDFTMERSLRAASSKKLLDGYTIFVTKNVSPPPDAMEEIIKSSGGVMVKKLLPNWPEKSVIISCQSDLAQLKKIRKPPPIVVAEWLLSGVLQQRLDTQNYKLN